MTFPCSLWPLAAAFASALVATLILTPLVRELNRRLGMVDKPDPRRINKVPVPRGGGLAVVIGVVATFSALVFVTGWSPLPGASTSAFWKLTVLSLAVAALGLADDRFNLHPKVKLLGQLLIAFAVWGWAGLGFSSLWPSLPAWVDAVITVFWIVGAVNAFNLIDGLDGLASGLALIATLGMAGTLFIMRDPASAFFHFAFAGGLLGFLRYNYNPASVFLGDCGSMYIGFTLATLTLSSQTPNSFLVSVGVPLLAMGVPIFDTALAILRRSIRHLIRRRDDSERGNGAVMTADADHLHHRILRSVDSNQRKAAWILYALAMFLVGVGLVGMALKSRSAGVWLVGFAAAVVVVFKDMARIELFDAGRLISSVARERDLASRRRRARLAVPLYLVFDLSALALAFYASAWAISLASPAGAEASARIIATFAFLVFFRTYRTIWSRAMVSNYVRLFLACVAGSVTGSAVSYYLPGIEAHHLAPMTFVYAIAAFAPLAVVRMARQIARDIFYAIDCSRLKSDKNVKRILVYGAGLRYRAFRRELVRRTAANDRMIVGILDDDIVLRGQFIGGIRVMGTINQAPEIIRETGASSVVIACRVTDEWMTVVRQLLEPTGVEIVNFVFNESKIGS